MLLPNSLVFALIPIALITPAVATVAFSPSTCVLSPSANHPIGALQRPPDVGAGFAPTNPHTAHPTCFFLLYF